MKKIFLILIFFLNNSYAQLNQFQSGSVIYENLINENFNIIEEKENDTTFLINSIPEEVNLLDKEIIDYNKKYTWSHYSLFNNGVNINTKWSENITEAGTYNCSIRYRSAPNYGNGDIWDVYFNSIITHTTSGRDANRMQLYESKTAHAFNGKDVFISYLNVLNKPGELQLRVAGENAYGTVWFNCKKLL